MARFTAGRAVVAALERAGIRHAFTVPGESFLEILDALRDSRIRLVAARHEAGAGFMAEGYGQLAGMPAACLVTRAVGTANLSIALHTARANSTPLVAIAGQVPRAFRGREAFQEADLVSTFGSLCKAAAELDDAATIDRDIDALLALASSGRPGPVLLSIPEDALLDDAARDPVGGAPGSRGSGGRVPSWSATGESFADEARPETPDSPPGATARDPATGPPPEDGLVREVLRILAEARRPVVLAGAGVIRSRAVQELAAFAEAADVPVMAAWRRPDVFDDGSPRYLGATGLSAARTVRPRLLEADVILAIGTRLSEIATFEYAVPGPGTTLLRVDVDPGSSRDRPAPAVTIRADAGAFLRRALALIDGSPTPGGRQSRERSARVPPAPRREDIARDRAAYLGAIALPEPGPRPADAPVHPATVIRALGRHLPGGAIITTDAGNFAGWAARYLPVPSGSRFLGPTSGAMGYGLPAAVGAAIAARDLGAGGRVVALAGDGGFSMLMAELETAVRERLPLAVIVFDNGMYGTIRMHQERAHPGRVAATDLGPIDFAAYARACGAQGTRVAHDADVDDAVSAALRDPGVTLVHVLTDPRIVSVDATLPA